MTPQAELSALRKVLETTKGHNQTLREENEKIRAELRTAVIDRDMFSRRMMEIREENDTLRDRLHRANLFSARAKYEAVLIRNDGWMKVVECPHREDNAFTPRPTRFVGEFHIFHLTDHHDPFGRPVYSEH